MLGVAAAETDLEELAMAAFEMPLLLDWSAAAKASFCSLERAKSLELCKGVHCVDLGESFQRIQTHIFLQSLVPRNALATDVPEKEGRSSRGLRQV